MIATFARLLIVNAQGRRTVPLDVPRFTIGRTSAASLYIESPDVSRDHAEIVRDRDRYLLHDHGSRGGTFVNGQRITERHLAHGDRIRFGTGHQVEVVFQSKEESNTGLSGIGADASDLRQMAAILNGLRAIGSGRVLDEVLTLVLQSAVSVTTAERGMILLAAPGGELEFKVGCEEHGPLSGAAFATSQKIPQQVFATGHTQIVENLLDVGVADAHSGTIAAGIRQVLCVPLTVSSAAAGRPANVEQQVIGVLYLDSRARGRLLSATTRASLEAFATQAALAIEGARLYAEAAEKRRIDGELRVAADIQRTLLPAPTCETDGWDLAAVSVPCRTVAGDFYDYMKLASGDLAVGLGDVAGKGPPAALLAVVLQSHFGAYAPVSADPADAMARINDALLRRAIEARFATMFYAVLSTDGRLGYCDAGQEPPLLLRADGSLVCLDTGGPVLGLLPAATYAHAEVHLQPGDLVVIYSDGVTEARSTANEEFGRDRLMAALAGMHGEPPEVILERLMAAVRDFSGNGPQLDDITAMVVRHRGVPDR